MDPLLCMNYRMHPFINEIDKKMYADALDACDTQLLYESRGLDDEVLAKSKELIRNIPFNIKYNHPPMKKDEYGRYISNCKYNTTLPEDYKLIVYYKCIYFVDYEDYRDNIETYKLVYNERNLEDHKIEINLTIPVIKEREIPTRYFDEPIYHELTHAYESIKCGGSFFGSDENGEQYKRITDIVLNKKGSEKTIKVARCIYACYKFERNAFVHGLYSKMAKYNALEVSFLYDQLKETEQYSYLMDIKTILDNPKEYENEIKELTGQNYTTFEKYIQKRYKKYMSSIGKIFQRIITDNMGNIPVNQFTDIDDVLSDII